MNTDAPDDYAREHLFLDEMRTARDWIAHSATSWFGGDAAGLRGALDADGYPTRLPAGTQAGTIILTKQAAQDAPLIGGRYRLDWQGTGTVTVSGGTNQTSGPGWREFDFTPSPNGHVNVRITTTNAAPNHIRGMRCYLVRHKALVDAGKRLHPAYIAAMGCPGVLRMMNLQRTNNSPQTTWAGRPTPARFGGALGASVEEMVALSNELGSSPWLCMPHRADDDYVERFAAYVRDNLHPDTKVFVEYSNEVWNLVFEQASWLRAQAAARWNLPGDQDGRWMQWAGMRAAQVMSIWTRVFGDKSSRLVRVAGVHPGWQGLENHFFDAPLWGAEGNRKPIESFDAVAITGYFYFPSNQMGNLIGRLASEPTQATLTWTAGVVGQAAEAAINRDLFPYWRRVATKRGKKLLMYEGGTHIVRNGGTANDAAVDTFFQRFNYSPEVANVYRSFLSAWDKVGDGGFAHYKSVAAPSQYGSWGARRHLTDVNPRWAVLNAYAKEQPL